MGSRQPSLSILPLSSSSSPSDPFLSCYRTFICLFCFLCFFDIALLLLRCNFGNVRSLHLKQEEENPFFESCSLIFLEIWWELLRRSFRNTLRGMELIRHSYSEE
ncbi:hypothetical protein P8452_03292 [Trifolium repens]|nr:hypothetical protein P8452_03292 [Trifolium repens]